VSQCDRTTGTPPFPLGPHWIDYFWALPNGVDLETNLSQLLCIYDTSTIKDEGGLLHRSVDVCPVYRLELVPLCRNDDGFRVETGLFCALANGDLRFDCSGWKAAEVSGARLEQDKGLAPLTSLGVIDYARLGQVEVDLIRGNLWIVDGDLCLFLPKVLA
jgi:hypothetical protein